MRYKVSIVKYTNTLPLRYGILNSDLLGEMDLHQDIPAECARKLLYDEVDIGLIPVAVIPQMKEYHIISNYCIGSKGVVDTVKLYSHVPLRDIETVFLDYQSKSSVTLTKVLAKNFWKVQPAYTDAKPGFEENIKGKEAAVVIGDRCFKLNGHFEYEYDLATEWKKFTGLPFVFAAWVSNKKVEANFIEKLERAQAWGIKHTAEAISKENVPDEVLIKTYLTERIDYVLDEEKKKALELFLHYIAESNAA